MKRKVRHPYQILMPEELVVGENYVFVTESEIQRFINLCQFGGIFNDNTILENRPNTTPPTVTIHMNGLNISIHGGILYMGYPTLIYWEQIPNDVIFHGWDRLSAYLGEECEAVLNGHSIIVPEKYWIDDSRFHVLDWVNPDKIIERKICTTPKSAVDIEKELRAKRDRAMAKVFGF